MNLISHFCLQSQRQQTLAAQREAKEKEIQRQREAEELLIAQQREARIQEEIIRSRKETNLLLLGKSAGEASGSKSHNPFFLARAPAPVKTSQNGSMTSCSNVLAEVVDLPEVRLRSYSLLHTGLTHIFPHCRYTFLPHKMWDWREASELFCSKSKATTMTFANVLL